MKREVAANVVGSIAVVAAQFVLVPVILKHFGPGASGIIGVSNALFAVLGLLDLGIAAAALRYAAANRNLSAASYRSGVRGLECLYVLIAFAVGAVAFTMAGFLTQQWLNTTKIPNAVIVDCLKLLAITSGFTLLGGFYRSVLSGMNQFVSMNVVIAISELLRFTLCYFGVVYRGCSLTEFFELSLIASVAQTVALVVLTWVHLGSPLARPSSAPLRPLKDYATGMGLIAVLSMVLLNIDKFALSRLLTLEQFGYYSIAAGIASQLGRLPALVFQPLLAKSISLAAKGDLRSLQSEYLKATGFISLLTIPPLILLCVFHRPLLSLYFGNDGHASEIAIPLLLLAGGWALNGLLHPPYAMTLTFGWTGFGTRQNLIGIAFMIPALYALTVQFGANGAAASWLLLNIAFFTVSVAVIHRHLRLGPVGPWYRRVVTLGTR